jgi:serine/threonine protein kinase
MATSSPPRKRFLREARSAAAVKHDNIVQVYSVEEQPSSYMVMEFVTGRPPFRAPSTVAVLKRVVDDTPRSIQEIIPETPDLLVAIIHKLLSKKPEDRFQSAKEVADLLGQCQSEFQLKGQVNGHVTNVPASNPNSADQLSSIIPPVIATPRREGPRAEPSGIWLLVWSRLLFLIVMLLVLVLLFDAWRFDTSGEIDAQIKSVTPERLAPPALCGQHKMITVSSGN